MYAENAGNLRLAFSHLGSPVRGPIITGTRVAVARIPYEHGKFRDSVSVAELARGQTTLDGALNSGEFSYKS